MKLPRVLSNEKTISQYHICPVRSMIEPRLLGKRVSTMYPLNIRENPSFQSALYLFRRNTTLRSQIELNFPNFFFMVPIKT